MEEIKKLIKYEYEEKGKSLRDLSVRHNVKLGTLKSWSSREKWKKKEEVATGNATKPKRLQPVADVKTKVQQDIIVGKTKEEIKAERGISERSYFRYKNELTDFLNKNSQEVLAEAIEYAYPDRNHLIKKLLGERRNILITAITNIKRNTHKDYQAGISKSIENINKVIDTVFKDMGIIHYEDLIKYLEDEKEGVKATKLSDILEEVSK